MLNIDIDPKSIIKYTVNYEFPVHSFKYKNIEQDSSIDVRSAGINLQNGLFFIEFFENLNAKDMTKVYVDCPTFDFKNRKYIVYSNKSEKEIIRMFKEDILEFKIEDVFHLTGQKELLEADIAELEKEIAELQADLIN